MLSVKHLNKKYKSRTIIHDISLHIQRGEIVGLLGPNGTGKTTSFYMILGLIPSDHGSIWLDDQNITRLPVHKRAQKGIGYLPQEASIFRKLTVAENIRAVLELQPTLTRPEQHAKMEQLLAEFRLTHVRDILGMHLSGGERRRAEIARTLAGDPTFILLDEPFAGIDPLSVMDIKYLMGDLRARNIGLLITDHNVRETLKICDRAYIVHQGRIICAGSAEVILQNTEVRKVYLGEEFNL